jgi:hypothetical protein
MLTAGVSLTAAIAVAVAVDAAAAPRAAGPGSSAASTSASIPAAPSAYARARAADEPAATRCAAHWVGSWTASPSDTLGPDEFAMLPQQSVFDQTFRMIITPHRGGTTLRIHLTNRNRRIGITYAHVTVAKQAVGAAIMPDTLRQVSFGGKSAVGVEANADVVSDPITLPFKAFEPLAVSVFVPGVALQPAEHLDGNATSYYGMPFSGDTSSDLSGVSMPMPITMVPLVSGLDVMAPGDVSAVVAFGDSITDGYVAANAGGFPQAVSIVDRNVRYPDFLQHRLDRAGKRFTVLNAGIVGNRLTVNGLQVFAGRSGEQRLRRDVIDQSGVTNVIVLEGINDLGERPRAVRRSGW